MMAEYESEEIGVKFSVPDEITVRQQLSFRSGIFGSNSESRFERFWMGARELVEDWESELVPDPMALDLDNETDPRVADIVSYVGSTVAGHIAQLGAIPKNG